MKNRLVYRLIAFVLICSLFPIIQLTSVVKVYSSENVLYQSTFDNKDGMIFLSNNWSILSGDLIPKYNDENRLVFIGTNKSDYVITVNATFSSGEAGRSGYGVYFRATNSTNISGYCFQYDNGVGKKFLIRKVIDGKEGVAQHVVSMSSVMGSNFDITAPHTVTITAIGSNFVIKVDDKEAINFTDSTFTSGFVGLRSWAISYNKFHDIKVVDSTPVPIPAKKPVRLTFDCAYMYGYEMGGVGAEDTIKREEAAALLYRLLKQNDKLDGFVKPNKAIFTDVATNRWSFSAVEYMASIGVFDKTSGKVRPGAEITRGEASKIIAYSMGMQPDGSKANSFTDLTTDNKYYSSIKALSDAGILKGYSDNTIKPNGLLTRAEYVTMINRLIGRDSSYAVDSEANPYPDMPKSHWAYQEIMRASFGFSDDGTGKLKIDPAKKLKRSEIDYN